MLTSMLRTAFGESAGWAPRSVWRRKRRIGVLLVVATVGAALAGALVAPGPASAMCRRDGCPPPPEPGPKPTGGGSSAPGRLTVYLYDDGNHQLAQYDASSTTPGGVIDLNPNYADRVDRVVVLTSNGYQLGDHIRLLDEPQSTDTDMVDIDPLVDGAGGAADVNLNAVNFADRAAGLQFILAPGSGTAGNRISLYDRVDQPYPTIVLYSWQSAQGTVDLSPLHFARKAAQVTVVTPGAPTELWRNRTFIDPVSHLTFTERKVLAVPSGTYNLNRCDNGPNLCQDVLDSGSDTTVPWADRSEFVHFAS